MFLQFFLTLRANGLAVSLREYLTLLEALDKNIGVFNVDDFYALCRATLIKHEKFIDKFDRLFGHYFKGMAYIPDELFFNIPDEWLRKNVLLSLTDEEKKLIESMGGLDKLMERFKELLEQQKERHEGGNRWIGTGGTSPFGAYGYNPEGYRIGQEGSRNRSAVKIWEKRIFQNLDEDVELNTRNIKMALRRLRVLTREGAQDELDLEQTINKTSKEAGLLNVVMRPSKMNRVKVLLFLDVGGSMDDHITVCAELFSAAKRQFKHLEFFYFHNCIYDSLWKDNRLRYQEKTLTMDMLHKFNRDYKAIVVGDAAMAPYELLVKGGSIDHYNQQEGASWLMQIKNAFPSCVWLNPLPEYQWQYFETVPMIRKLFDNRMFPLTVHGLTDAMKVLTKKYAYFQQPH